MKDTDLQTMIQKHPKCKIKNWGGWMGKNDDYTSFGYLVETENKIYFFDLDEHFIKEKIK